MKPKQWKPGDRVWFERVDFIHRLRGTVGSVGPYRVVIDIDGVNIPLVDHPQNLHRLVKKKKERVFISVGRGWTPYKSLEEVRTYFPNSNEYAECIVVKRHKV